MRTRYIIILAGILLFGLTTTKGFSQNLLQQDPGEEIKEIARETTQLWDRELSLTAKQARLMERKIIEYEIRKEELMNSKMEEAAKKKRLVALQDLETQDMRDILTKPQYDRYLDLLRERAEGNLPNHRQ